MKEKNKDSYILLWTIYTLIAFVLAIGVHALIFSPLGERSIVMEAAKSVSYLEIDDVEPERLPSIQSLAPTPEQNIVRQEIIKDTLKQSIVEREQGIEKELRNYRKIVEKEQKPLTVGKELDRFGEDEQLKENM